MDSAEKTALHELEANTGTVLTWPRTPKSADTPTWNPDGG
jgi:hypothetical protein